jgi:ABC-type multidrug transport system fused ATPase/permease subunit
MNLILLLFRTLNNKHKKRLIVLQILVVVMAFSEVASVVSIALFMSVVSDVNILQGGGVASRLFDLAGSYTPFDFIYFLGVAVIIVLVVSTVLSILTVWRLSLFANEVGVELGDRLYNYYIHKPWLYHTSNNSSELTKKIAFEADRLTMSIIVPLMQLNSKVVLAIFISTLVFIYNPAVAIAGFVSFLIIYLCIYALVRRKLSKNSNQLSESNRLRYKLISEVFGGIKDVLLLGRQNKYSSQFILSGKKFSHSRATNQALVHAPRYVVELIAFGAIILSVLFLIQNEHKNLADILPILSVYAMAGYKLLPAFQQIYANIGTVKGNLSAFNSIREDLINSKEYRGFTELKHDGYSPPILFNHEIIFKDVYFKYPTKDMIVIDGVNLTVPFNKTVGLVGSSGSGKSTLIDLLCGLLTTDNGGILVDGTKLTDLNIRSFQNQIGYVPQSIFLLDGSISENIAFGIPEGEIDYRMIDEVIKLSHLKEFIDTLADDIYTNVGERGVQLSGGQRQRIGIARALYNSSNLLILDEATSALDGITEKIIMDAIQDFAGKKTIIMIAHRLKTVEKCDIIYLLDKGKVVDQGSYQQLINRNISFRNMARET